MSDLREAFERVADRAARAARTQPASNVIRREIMALADRALSQPEAVEAVKELATRERFSQAALARIRKVRDEYANQAKFADVEPASYFREFIRRLDRAVDQKQSSPPWNGGAAPPLAPDARMRGALELAEDVLSRAPFSTAIWPNGMHPQRGIGIIREALSRADDGKTYRVEYDGFVGTVQGSYVTREGKPGVVLQQVGTKVVHVYGRNRVVPVADEGKESEGGKQPLDGESATLRQGSLPSGESDHAVTHGSSVAGYPTPAEQREAIAQWPDGCRNPNSCSIHRDCMYLQCKHYDRDISGEVDAALSTRALSERKDGE